MNLNAGKPKRCDECRRLYQPTSRSQRYCPTCKPIKDRERARKAQAAYQARRRQPAGGDE